MWLAAPRSSAAPHFDGQRWASAGGFHDCAMAFETPTVKDADSTSSGNKGRIVISPLLAAGSLIAIRSLVSQWNRHGNSIVWTDHKSGVPLAFRVLDQADMARANRDLLPSCHLQLRAAGERDHELPSGPRMPIGEVRRRTARELDAGRLHQLGAVVLQFQLDPLGMALAVSAGVHARDGDGFWR